MDIWILIGIAVALAMDAFAVALSVGVTVPFLTWRHYFRLGFHFGLFQALMPIIGWLAGRSFYQYIVDYDHWIAFTLLSMIGGHMIYEARHPDRDERKEGDPTRDLSLMILSIATSIDALAIGLSLAMLGLSVWFPALIIGLVACLFTLTGLRIGRRIGELWGARVEIIGGLILILIGIKVVLEHTLS
jgi:putative Mn2+ efflux pump MntP